LSDEPNAAPAARPRPAPERRQRAVTRPAPAAQAPTYAPLAPPPAVDPGPLLFVGLAGLLLGLILGFAFGYGARRPQSPVRCSSTLRLQGGEGAWELRCGP